MSSEAIKKFLDGFSVEVTPKAASKIENFEDYIPSGTLVYIAHIEGTPIEEMVETAKKINDQGLRKLMIKAFVQCLIFLQELSRIRMCLKTGFLDIKMKLMFQMRS